ncbi:MAG: 4-(cytidine 5'-diphospho)-2-C-methyl-D-erythritol kinase [Syntrophobacteraceae bacterium]
MIQKMRVPAKINLWLEVIRKREDGYHDISSLMLPVSVFDDLSVEIRSERGPISLSCDNPEIPADEGNLAWQAAELFLKMIGGKAEIHISLGKAIPSGAGLGGGSSDAAGVLLALNSCFGNPIPLYDLEKMACRLGADVPFFLHGRPALATGIGENLEFASGTPEYSLVLIKPPVSVPTGWVYQNLKLTREAPQIKLGDLNAHPWQLEALVANDLESVTIPRYPIISELKDWLRGNGALAASMSGSGPTVFGVFSSPEAAGKTEESAKKAWRGCWVNAAEVICTGSCSPPRRGACG